MRSLHSYALLLMFSFMSPYLSHAAPQGTVPGDVNLFMVKSGTGSSLTGVNNIFASLGDTISIDVFIKNYGQIPISAFEVYLTVDSRYFNIAAQGINEENNKYKGQIKPFIQGLYLKNAGGSIQPFGNNTAGDLTSDMDNKFPGWQMNYIELTGPDVGSGRPTSRLLYGVVCTYKLIAIAPCDSVAIRLDNDAYYQRVSQYYNPYTSDSFLFQYNFPTYITVTGITVFPPIPDLRMVSGTSDSTLDLDDHVGLASLPKSSLNWSARGNTSISVSIDSLTHRVTFTAPKTFKGSEDVIFTVEAAKGITASDTMKVTAGTPPKLLHAALPDTIRIHEDVLEPALALKSIAEDADDDYSSLKWKFLTAGGKVTPSAVSDTLFLKGILDFNGLESLMITVTDPLGGADSLAVPVRVLPVNDPPSLKKIPDITIRRNQTFNLDLSTYAVDVDNDPLIVTWKTPANLTLSKAGMQVSFAAAGGFIGNERVIFTVTDPGGLSATDSLMVTVTPAKEPPVWSRIPKIGFPQGKADSSLVIWNYVADADDADNLLTFVFANLDNVDSVFVNPRTGRVTFYDRDNAPGWDRLTVTAFDPDGNRASIQFPVFIGPADGTPITAGIPDTTIVAGSQGGWIDLDDYYYDVDNTDSQMKWTWGRQAGADSSVTVTINPITHSVILRGLGTDKYGINRFFFTVTDPGGKFGDDICIVSAVGLNKPALDLPKKVGFIAGGKYPLDLDDYVQDAVYDRKDLTWQWTGNRNVAIQYDTPAAAMTRPISFSGASSWKGWERIAFEVQNPLGGAARDTVLVFSVPPDGSPITGGLDGITLKAGECTQVNLDDYFYDADTTDYQMKWTSSGGDSLKVTIDSFTHVATVCTLTDTWEGASVITFKVTDPENHSASLIVPATVTGAVIRDAFAVMLFRNPMQEDYIDVYVKSRVSLTGSPTFMVYAAGDSAKVTVTVLGTDYFSGRYLLPLKVSAGMKGTATVQARGVAQNSKIVSNRKDFAYGRIDKTGGKLALGGASLDIPPGAADGAALVTLISESPPVEAGKTAVSEIEFRGEVWRIGPSTFRTGKPMTLAIPPSGAIRGAGIYRMNSEGPQFMGGAEGVSGVTALITEGGAYRLGYDLVPPTIGDSDASGTILAVTVTDGGSGIDESTIRVNAGGRPVTWRFDRENSRIVIDASQIPGDVSMLDVAVSDRSGNTSAGRLAAEGAVRPFALDVRQNIPNPFNPTTVIPFSISREARATVEVFDLTGRKVALLADRTFPAGAHSLVWNARDDRGRPVSSGTYLYRISAGGRTVSGKMMLLR